MSSSDLTSASLMPQSPLTSIFATGSAIALLLVEIDEAVDHGVARQHLQFRIERGAHRQAALVELLLTVIVVEVAAHFLGEIFGGKDVRARRAHGHVKRLLFRLGAVGRRDEAVFDHAVDHVIAPRDRLVLAAERIVIVRSLRQAGEIGRLRDAQLVHRLVEVQKRGRGDAIGAEAEIDFVEIEFEDFLLRIGALDAQRQQRFLDLALERHLIVQQEVLGDLLGDGRGALRPPPAAVVLDIEHAGANDAVNVDARMVIEILVLRRHEGVGDELRDRLDRQIKPALLGIFGEQRAVGGMHPRHHRRLIVLKLGVVRQILGVMPQQACGRRDAGDEQDRARREQKAQKAQEQFHRYTDFIEVARPRPGLKHRHDAAESTRPAGAAVPAHKHPMPSIHYPLSSASRRSGFCSN